MTDQSSLSTNEENAMSKEDFLGFNSMVENGDIEALERFITDKSITPEIYYQYFHSHYVYKRCGAVGVAAKFGQLSMMKKLISLGFRIHEKSLYFDKAYPIHLACEAGNVAVVKSLVEDYGVDVGHRDNCYGTPALCYAVSNRKLDVIEYFLENGTDINRTYGVHGTSMLHCAAEENQLDVCEYLLSKGANVDVCNSYKNTPLIMAARYDCVAIAGILLDAGADVNFLNDEQETPFQNAAENGNMDMIKLLGSYGADPDQYQGFNYSPLHHAVSVNRYDIAHYLVIDLNVSLEPDEDYDESPFRIALREARFDLVDLLVRAGYNPVEEVKTFDGDSGDEDVDMDLELQKKLNELNCIIRNPRSLQALGVYTIRRLLGRRLSTTVDRLPVCEPIKKIVMYCDVTV